MKNTDSLVRAIAADGDAKTQWSCLQDAQINRTQLVASTGGEYPDASLGSTDSVGTGRTKTSRVNEKVHPNQSRFTNRGSLEWIGVAFSVRCVLQHDELVQQPFWQPASLTLE